MKTKPWLKEIPKALACGKEFFYAERSQFKIEKFGKIRGVRIGEWLYLQQSPETGSYYAQLASRGTRIIWIIFRGEYKGVIIGASVLMYDKNGKLKQEGKI